MIQAYIVVILSKVLAFISAIYLLDYINKYIPDSFFTTVFGLGEVAFVRWLVCRKAILPNPCYKLAAVN